MEFVVLADHDPAVWVVLAPGIPGSHCVYPILTECDTTEVAGGGEVYEPWVENMSGGEAGSSNRGVFLQIHYKWLPWLRRTTSGKAGPLGLRSG